MKEFEGNPGHEGSLLHTTTFITLIENREVDLSELIQVAREAIAQDIPAAYTIEDKRVYSETGASGSGQDVIVSLASAAMNPTIAGASGAIVSYLVDWAKERKKQDYEVMQLDQMAASGNEDLDFTILRVKGMLCRAFGISEDDLIVDDAELRGNEATVRISDQGTGRVYLVKTSENNLITRIQEIQG